MKAAMTDAVSGKGPVFATTLQQSDESYRVGTFR
jgi:hypothetical protein